MVHLKFLNERFPKYGKHRVLVVLKVNRKYIYGGHMNQLIGAAIILTFIGCAENYMLPESADDITANTIIEINGKKGSADNVTIYSNVRFSTLPLSYSGSINCVAEILDSTAITAGELASIEGIFEDYYVQSTLDPTSYDLTVSAYISSGSLFYSIYDNVGEEYYLNFKGPANSSGDFFVASSYTLSMTIDEDVSAVGSEKVICVGEFTSGSIVISDCISRIDMTFFYTDGQSFGMTCSID